MIELKYAIFDLDGTLLDSMGFWKKADIEYFNKHNVQPTEEDFNACKHFSFDSSCKYYIQKYDLSVGIDEVKSGVKEIMKDAYANKIQLKPYSIEILEYLYSENVVMGVASTSVYELLEPAIDKYNLKKYFKYFLTSDKTNIGKETSRYYDICAKKLNINEKDKKYTCVFEDALMAIKSALKGGYTVIGVDDFSSKNEREEKKKLSHSYINTFKDLKGRIKILK